MSLVYGYDVIGYDDHLLAVARKMAELVSAVMPGTVLANEIPLCESQRPHLIRKTDSVMNSSETYPGVGTVVELQTRSASGLQCRTVPHATTEDDNYEGYFIPKGLLFCHDNGTASRR